MVEKYLGGRYTFSHLSKDKMDQITVSVIVPCYNQGNYLSECLNSVLVQTFEDWECIIINDGSSDHTEEVAKQFLNDKRFKYIYQKNSGVSQARNNAIKVSKGKYILPLDGDDKIAASYLKKAVAVMENDTTIALTYCDAEYFGDLTGKWQLPVFSYELLLKKNIIFCSVLYRKTDYDQTGGYDAAMTAGLEDWEFLISLLKNNRNVFKINEVLFYYRKSKGSRNISFNEQQRIEIKRYIFNKHIETYREWINILDLLLEIDYLKKSNRNVAGSLDYRVGRFVLSGYRFLKKYFISDKPLG